MATTKSVLHSHPHLLCLAPAGWLGFSGQCLVSDNPIVAFEVSEYRDSHLAMADRTEEGATLQSKQ